MDGDKELFIKVIESTSEALNHDIEVVEKDYCVTMILKLLQEMNDTYDIYQNM